MATLHSNKAEFYTDPAVKPKISPPCWDMIPEVLRMAIRWVLWRLVWKPNTNGSGKWDKVPFQTTGRAAKANSPDTWTTFEKVKTAFVRGKFDGIGFMLGGGFAGVDLDNAIDPETGELKPWAAALFKRLATYGELSPSGTGIKLFGSGLWTGDRHRWKVETGEIEIYSERRFFAVTGAIFGEWDRVQNVQPVFDELAGEYRKPDDVLPPPHPPGAGALTYTDEEIVHKAKAAKNGPKFTQLWLGDTSDYGNDDSAADLALCVLLAFWTGPNDTHIDRLFRLSGLMRRKWDEKRGAITYGQLTIRKALEGRTEFHDPDYSKNTVSFSAQSPSVEWPEPIPLRPAFDPPRFPVEVLSPWMAEYAVAVAEEKQVPVDLPSLLILGVAAAGISRKVVVSPRPAWTHEPTNLFIMCCLPPGERKSQTFNAIFDPVNAIEREKRTDAEPHVKEAESEFRVKQKRVDHLEAKIAKEEDAAARSQLMECLKEARAELQAVKVPVMPLLRVDDDTPEMMALELVKQEGRLLAASPEARTLENIDRYSDKPNMDVFLKGHAGDDIRTGRVSRGRDSVDRPALTCVYSPQPCVLEGLGATPELRGRGFLARWFFSLPASAVGYRKVRSARVPDPIRVEYETALINLWLTEYADAEKQTPHELTLTQEAQTALEEFEKWREPQLQPGGELSLCGGWGNKLNGLCARICAVLHTADSIRAGEGWKTNPISAEVVHRAVKVCREYAIPHALAAFGLMGESVILANTRKVLRWLGSSATLATEFSKKQVFDGCRGTFETVAELEPVLELLMQHFIIRPKQSGSDRPGPGRKASPRFEVNPKAFEVPARITHNPQNSVTTRAGGNSA